MNNLGYCAVPRFEMIAAMVRKFHGSLLIILQISCPLAAIYRKESANTILSGAGGPPDLFWRRCGDRICTMLDDEALLILENKEPIKLEPTPYFRNRKF